MATLSSYLTEVQRLLHDANSVFWSTQELTDYINDARERVARDTGCLRTLQITATPISSTGVAVICKVRKHPVSLATRSRASLM